MEKIKEVKRPPITIYRLECGAVYFDLKHLQSDVSDEPNTFVFPQPILSKEPKCSQAMNDVVYRRTRPVSKTTYIQYMSKCIYLPEDRWELLLT